MISVPIVELESHYSYITVIFPKQLHNHLKTGGGVVEKKKTKGQQLKGKTVSALFHTLGPFPGYRLSSEIPKEKDKPFCTLVVARLCSSY